MSVVRFRLWAPLLKVALNGRHFYEKTFAQIAQSVEQRIENPRVGGSIPPLGTTILETLISNGRGFLLPVA